MIIDLTVSIGPDTYAPPSVNRPVGITVRTKEPGWQVTEVQMALHTGPHVDFSKHYRVDGETAERVALDRVVGIARVFDLGQLDPGHAISPDELAAADPGIRPGEIALLRTAWTDRAWGDFPRYYVDSPTCSPAAATWLVSTGAKAIGFDCFPEEAAKRADYRPADFIVHRIIGDGGAVLMQQLTAIDALPAGIAIQFAAAFLKFEGAEGAPARFFAVV
jgi:kynurenine formamidase